MQTETSNVATRARLNAGRQWIGIRNLEFIEEVQPRAGLDRGWVNDLSRFRLEGSEFPPIRVYQTPDGRLIPGEGHHRSMAMASAGEDQILCNVVDGTMEDAIIFAAGSNRSNGVKPMGPKDITKAVEMLLSLDAWWGRSDNSIANHVGTNRGKVKTIRSRICAMTGRSAPEFAEASNGRTVRYWRGTKNASVLTRQISRKDDGRYRASVDGKFIHGTTPESVREQLEQKAEEAASRKVSLSYSAIKGRLNQLGFQAVFEKGLYPGLSAFHYPGLVASPCDLKDKVALPVAVASLIAARRLKEPGARLVIICYACDGGMSRRSIDLYRAEGFEFLTPEELTESLKES
jgi:hypothetical protein